MKIFNLIKRLWTDSHEKQTPQRFGRYAAILIMLLTLGVRQMWATVTIYAVGNMQDNGGNWRDEKTTLKCHNWGTTETTWPGTTMTKWNDVSVDGHQVFKCNLAHDNNSYCIFNNSWQTNNISLTSTIKAYPYPTYLNGDWVYSPRVAKALWEGDQHAYGGRVYFDNSSANWSSTYMYLVIGHATYVGYYRMNQIGNTKLYYVDLGSQSWGDSKYVAVVGHSSSKSTGSGNPNNLAALNKFSDVVNYSLDYESTYLVSMSSGTNCTPISIDYQSSGYSAFNSTQTINTVVKAAGGSYTAANSKATISITSYEMTDNGSVTKRTPSISTSAKTATVSAARTATTTLSVGDVATGYQFDGWYTAATGGTKLSESTTYTYYPTSATTVYARFSEKTFTVTVTNDGNGTTSPSGAQSNKGQITGVAVSATPSDGYNFNNWTITSGTGSFADATDESTTFYPTATATIRANFVSAATSTLTVTATAGGSITTPAAGYYSDITTTGYSIAASRSEGYKFTGWTKTAGDGAVSFSDASSLSTTATITTLGDVTVTAGFAAMSNALSVSSSSVYAGSNVTLTATKTNHTLDLKYQYKIGSGSWNTITTKSGTSHTYTIPYANTYQTYYFRVVSTDGSTDIISPTQTVEVKGRITIHVKNTNSWATMKLYSWYNDGSDHATNGAWNGTTGTGSNGQSCSVHATGSQWWDVTITQTTSNAQKFILSCSTSGDQNKTADLNLSSFTHDAYYAMSTNGSSAQTLSTTTTPAAPTLSTSAAGTIRETSAVLGGNVTNLGNDIISERGYYWSTNSALSSSNLGVGTKVTVDGTQSSTGTFSNTKSSLSAGTKYYFIAYAKNGYGTSYGAVNNFTTLSTYTVTVATESASKGTVSPSSVTVGQYQSATITASPTSGYVFHEWTKSANTITLASASSKSTTVTATSTGTVTATFYDKWTIKGSGTELGGWSTYNSMTPTGNTDEYSVTVALAARTTYDFKVVNRVDGGGDGTFYGRESTTFTRGGTTSATGLVTTGGDTYNMHLTTDAAGNYTFTFKYNASEGSMKMTIGFPTAYTITFDKGTGGATITATGSASGTLTSGNYVASGEDVTFTQTATSTGYTFTGWYTTKDTGGSAVSGMGVSDNVLENVTSNKTVWSRYTANNYTVTFDATTNGGTCATASKGVTFGSAYGTLPNATHASRQFIGWYTTASGEGTRVTAETIVSNPSNHTLYARFESTFEVTVTYKCGSDVLYPSNVVYASATSLAADISAPEILGYRFVNWTGSNATFGDASSATTTVNASALTTITANYAVVPTVYFKNNLGWDSVFVTFDCSFIAGKQNVPSNTGHPYFAMTQLGATDVYYCAIPDSIVANNYAKWKWNIAFDNTNYGKTAKTTNIGTWDFYEGECVGRGDFDPKATMYIPFNGDTETRNSATFYKTGCWMKYNSTDPGYQVKVNTMVTGANSDTCTVSLSAPVAGGYEFSGKVWLRTANYGYGFKLYKDKQINTNDLWYSNKGSIHSNTTTLPWEFATKIDDEAVTADTRRCELYTEAKGDYEFTVSFATGKPIVNVTYPVSAGDYRLVYKDLATWSNGAHSASWYHPSRVIKAKANAEDIVSFYIAYGSSPSILLQKCTSIDGSGNPVWNAGTSVTIGATAKGIYNYKVTQDGSKNATVTFDGGYNGNFYVRTDVSDGGWSNYKTSGTNTMTYSEYAEDNYDFTHYFMRFVNKGLNIKFCIANDYSECISDTLVSDSYTNEWIEAYANVRFMWDHRTNKISRAYISGSSNVSDRFLVLEGSTMMYDEDGNALTGVHQISGLEANEMKFIDDQNWIYEATIKANPKAKALLTAKYNGKIQYFGGSGPLITDSVLLIGGSDANKYKIRVVYDFKTNRLLKAFIPDGAITTDLAIETDLMIIRDHQEDAKQVTFDGGSLSKVKTVYGAMMFNKWTVNNKHRSTHETLSLSRYERDLFYISFPFDVKLSDVFGFGTYGKHWILEYYDGKTRAANGFWADSDPNWKFVMPSQRHSFTMKAFEGYILALDLDELTESSSVWNNNVENVYIYFPSTVEVEDIARTNRLVTIDQTGYECTINRPTPDGDRTIKDSYWHCIGVPSFANYSGTLYDVNGGTPIDWSDTDTDKDGDQWTTPNLPYLYEVNLRDKSLSVTSSATFSFKATWSYLVQYQKSSIYWSNVNVTPAAIVARRSYQEAPTNAEFRIELQQAGEKADQTFVRLTDEENVTTGFDFNYDLSKEFNKNKANIYTMVTTVKEDGPSITEVAGNVQPMTEQTTIVPLGMKIAKAGEYTISIPSGTSGVGVTLVDNETGIRTNLALEDYTVALEAGTQNDRFYLEISPIKHVATDIELLNGENGENGVRKVMNDGILYIIRDGRVFNAQGARVK